MATSSFGRDGKMVTVLGRGIDPCCPQWMHDATKRDWQTFVAGTRNLREAESGADHIKLMIGECLNCKSTLGFEVTK